MGVLQPLMGDVTRLPDRFFLGGPLQLKGFRTKGLGPRAKIDGKGFDAAGAKGGDAYFAAGAAITTMLPSQALQAANARLHAFANCGNNVAISQRRGQGGSRSDGSGELFEKARCVLGVGVVLPLQNMRVEVNYCWAVRAYRELGDRLARWQVGIGFES